MNSCEFGKEGEHYAATILEADGFEIIFRNFRIKIGEIDLIALKNQTLYFFEIKTYRPHLGYIPEQAITLSKIKKMQKVGMVFYSKYRRSHKVGCRFELIKVKIVQQNFVGIERIPIRLS